MPENSRWKAACAGLALAMSSAATGQPVSPQPVLATGESVEVEVCHDLDADGTPDLAYIARGEDSRELRVVLNPARIAGKGESVSQVLPLDPWPLGDATLEVKRGVLLLTDLTGGTTAVSSTRRFRYDGTLQAMRLIGLDATLYSRTYAHDGAEVSWNLLTGAMITRVLHLNTGGGDAAYDPIEEKRSSRKSPPLRLENSPEPEDLLGWPGGG